MLASGGYPLAYEKGKKISGLAEAAELPDTFVFHAGTKKEGRRIVTNGGRVLGVTAVAGTLGEAVDRAYAAADKITFEGAHMRRDIGRRALQA